jgi:hypothetical protein
VCSQINGLKFRVVSDTSKFSSDNTVAHYAPGKNAIELNNALFNSLRIKNEEKASTIVHEMIHAVTCYVMQRYEMGVTQGLSQAQIDACQDIFDVYEAIKDDPEVIASLRQGTKISDNAEYGLSSAYEMMAELANPVFKARLKAKKLWRYLINGIKQLFGISIPRQEALEETNAYAVLDRAFNTLLDEFNGHLYDSYVSNAAFNSDANKDVFEMGSRVPRRMREIKEKLKGVKLDESQRAVVDAFTGEKDNTRITVEREDGTRTIIMRQGSEGGAGTKHSIYRHYGTGVGVINAEDLKLVPEVLAKGDRVEKQRGSATLNQYKMTDDKGTTYTVVTEVKDNREIFNDFYTNKKAPESIASRRAQSDANTPEGAHSFDSEASDGAKVRKNSESQATTNENAEELDADILLREREEPAPKKTLVMYKLFDVDANGAPHALFIDSANALKMGTVWYDADSPQMKDLEKLEPNYSYLIDSKGKVVDRIPTEYVKGARGWSFKGMPSKKAVNAATDAAQRWMSVTQDADGARQYHTIGINGSGGVTPFALRPGWHATDVPSARHIGAGKNGGEAMYRKPNQRWFMVEIAADNDYNNEVRERYLLEHPNMSREDVYKGLKGDLPERIPTNGFYDFRTNSNANPNQRWVISGAMRIIRPLSENEAHTIARTHGVKEDLSYKDGVKNFDDEPTIQLSDDVEREGDGYGAYNDEELSFMNDMTSRLVGKNRFSKAQQEKFAARQRKLMEQRVKDLSEKLHLTNVEVVPDATGLTGKRAKAKGFFNRKTGKITIILSNNSGEFDIEQTLLHEAVGHYGLREMFGEHFNTFLDNVFEAAEPEIRRRITALAAKKDWDFRTATEEYLASLAEDTEFGEMHSFPGWWREIKNRFLNMLEKIGFEGYSKRGIELSDNELRYILWRSYENLAEPGRYRSILGEAADVAMQDKLHVGDYSKNDNVNGNAAESEYLLRDSLDYTQRERMYNRVWYNSIVWSGSYQFHEAIQDSMLGLKRFMQSVLDRDVAIEDIPGYENAYLFENRMSSMNVGEQHEYYVKYFKPLLQTISGITGKSEDERKKLVNYIMAKHGLERNQYMRDEARAKGESWRRDFAGLIGLTKGMDWMDADAIAQHWVDDYETYHLPDDISNLWEAINTATKATLEKLYLSGILSKETFDKVRDMYRFYIPLRGWSETTSDEVYGYLTNDNRTIGGSVMKKAEGRESLADDPIATIAMMADEAIRQGNRNLMKQRFLNFVLNHPSDIASVKDLWLRKDDATGFWEPVFADLDPSDTPEEVERKIENFEATMEALKKNEPDKYKRGREAANVPYKVVKGNLREHQVLVKRGGRTYVITINGNPRAAQAVNGLTNPDVDVNGAIGNLIKLGSKINRQLAAFYTTRNPDFVVSNFFRDMIYSNCMAWVKESPRYALSFHKNFARVNPAKMFTLLKKWEKGTLSDYDGIESQFKQFMLNGGETGYTNVRDIENYKRNITKELNGPGNVGRRVWTAIGMVFDLLNRSAENCARFAAFLTSREYGRSIDRSVYDAKEVSVNFNKKGSGGKMINATGQTTLGQTGAFIGGIMSCSQVFWNAGVQGVTNNLRAGKRHPVKLSAGAAALYGFGVVVPLLAMMMSGSGDDGDENEYYNLPEYIRRSNICIKAGKQWITIPLPIESRALYGLGELTTGVISNHERYNDEELAFQILSQVSQIMPLDMLEGGGGWQPFIPSALKPVAEAYILNRSWTGMPIYRDSYFNKDDPEWAKAYASTDKQLVDFARWLNATTGGDDYKKGKIDINPSKLEYILNGYFGGMYTFPSKIKKAGETAIGKRDFEWRNMPLANRLVKSGDERTAYRKLKNEYFNYLDEYNQTKRLYRKYLKARDNGVMEYAEKVNFLENSQEFARYVIFDAYKSGMDSYREAIAAETDEAQKKELEQEMYSYMKNLVEALREPDAYLAKVNAAQQSGEGE